MTLRLLPVALGTDESGGVHLRGVSSWGVLKGGGPTTTRDWPGDVMKSPNMQLGTWLARSGWSRGELARRVRSLAAEWGDPHIRPDTSSVRRWVDEGELPRPPVPA